MSTAARRTLVAVLVVTFGVAALLSPFASGSPDGLEKVAADEGFAATADDHALGDGPFADYGVAGIGDQRVGTAIAGLVGVVLILGATWLLSRAVKGRGAPSPTSAPSTPT